MERDYGPTRDAAPDDADVLQFWGFVGQVAA
jgi:hypothetical protein